MGTRGPRSAADLAVYRPNRQLTRINPEEMLTNMDPGARCNVRFVVPSETVTLSLKRCRMAALSGTEPDDEGCAMVAVFAIYSALTYRRFRTLL
jgi:hypothetical protein